MTPNLDENTNTAQRPTAGGHEAPAHGGGRALPVQARVKFHFLKGLSSRASTLSFLCLVPLAACVEKSFDQVGYFKDSNNNRVFQLVALPNVGGDELFSDLENLAHTDGQMTIAFVFETGTGSKDRVTMARDFVSANAAIFDADERFRWWFRRSPSGETLLVDCVDGNSTVCDGISQ